MQLRKQESESLKNLPYGCPVCGKQFATSAGLRVHSRCHSVTQAVVSHPVVTQNSRSRPFVCNECGRRFYQSSNLNTHLKLHRSTKLHKCEVCEKQFILKNDLVKHLKEHTLEKEKDLSDDCGDKVKCETSSEIICDEDSKCESKSGNKVKCETGSGIICDKSSKCESKSRKKKVECETGSDKICDKRLKCEFENKVNCETGNRSSKCESDSVINKTKCEIGSDITSDKKSKCESSRGNKKVKCETGNDLTYHKRLKCENDENKKVKYETNCDISCDKKLKCKSDFNSGNKNSKCETSPNEDYDKESQFRSSKNSCCDEESKCETETISDCDKDMKCEYCEKIFTESDSYEMHLKTHTNSPVVCRLCGKSFKEAQYLTIHMRIHSGNKPYTCPVCKKSFSQLSNYSTHLRIHSGEKPYHCDICDKTFSNSGNRDTHRRTHTGEKPFMCDICGLSFARPNSLKMHHNLHTGERPYQCDQCEKAFVSSGKLVDHKRTHTGEKPYTCEICGLSFAIVNTFKRHKKIHSGQKPHLCVHCGKRFFRREGLRSHLKIHTGQASSGPSDSHTLPMNTDQSSDNTLGQVPVVILPTTAGQASHNAPDGVPIQVLHTYTVPVHTQPILQTHYKTGKISGWTRHDSMEGQLLKDRTDLNKPNSVEDRSVYKKHIEMDGTLFRESSDDTMYRGPRNDTMYMNQNNRHNAVYEEPSGHVELQEPTNMAAYKEPIVHRDPFVCSLGSEPMSDAVYAVSDSGNDSILCRDREHLHVGDTDYSASSGVHNTLYRQHVDVDDHRNYDDSSNVLEDDAGYRYSLKQTAPVMYEALDYHNREMYGVHSCGNSKILVGCDSQELADKYSRLLPVSLPHKMPYSYKTHTGLNCSVGNLNVSDLQVLSKQKGEPESKSTSGRIYLPNTLANTAECFENRTCQNDRSCSGYFYNVPSRDNESDSSSSYQTSLKNLEPVGSLCLPQNTMSAVVTSESTNLPQHSFTSDSAAGETPQDNGQSHQSQSDAVNCDASQQSPDATNSVDHCGGGQTFSKYYMNHLLQVGSQAIHILPVIKGISTVGSDVIPYTEAGKAEHSQTSASDPSEKVNSEPRVSTSEPPGAYSSESRSRILESGAGTLKLSMTSKSEPSRAVNSELSETDNLEYSEQNNSEHESIENNDYGSYDSLQINSHSRVQNLSCHSITKESNMPVNGNMSRNDSHTTGDHSCQEDNHESEPDVYMSLKPRYLNELGDDSDGDICVDEDDEEQFLADKSSGNVELNVEGDKLKGVLFGTKFHFRELHEECQNDYQKSTDSVGTVSNRACDIYDVMKDAANGTNILSEKCTVDSGRKSSQIDGTMVNGCKIYNKEFIPFENKEGRKTVEKIDSNALTNYATSVTAKPQEVNSVDLIIASKRRRVTDSDHMDTRIRNYVDVHYRNSDIQNSSSVKAVDCGKAKVPVSLNGQLKDRCKSSQYTHFSTSQSINIDSVTDSITRITDCNQSSTVKLLKCSLSCKEDTCGDLVHANEVIPIKKGHMNRDKADERIYFKVNLDGSVLGTNECDVPDTSIKSDPSVVDDNERSKSFLSADIKFNTKSDVCLNDGHSLSMLSKNISGIKHSSFDVPAEVGCGLSNDYVLLTEMDVKTEPDSNVCVRVESIGISTVKSVAKCRVCKSVFANHVELDEHLQKNPHHIIKCHICGKEFSDQQYLKNHARVHTKERPYECEICGKRFAQSGNYVIHMRIHTGDKPYICPVCNKCFTSSGNRDSHQKIHSGDRPYMCDICGETFSRPGSLKTHRRIHTGERPYRCDLCDRAFVSSGKLKDHRRIHTGEKPYVCEVCGLSFAIVNTFRRHKKIHTGDRPHRCVVCSKSFIRLEGLRNHQKTHKKDKQNDSVDTDVASFGDLSGHVMSTDVRTDTSLGDSTAIKGSVHVGSSVFDGYPSSAVSHLKHPQMVFDSALDVSQNTECHRSRDVGDVRDRDVYFYENVGDDMSTFVYHQH